MNSQILKKILSLIGIIILVASCSSGIGFQKRRYNRGVYFSGSTKSNHPASSQNNTFQAPLTQETTIQTQKIESVDKPVATNTTSSTSKNNLTKRGWSVSPAILLKSENLSQIKGTPKISRKQFNKQTSIGEGTKLMIYYIFYAVVFIISFYLAYHFVVENI